MHGGIHFRIADGDPASGRLVPNDDVIDHIIQNLAAQRLNLALSKLIREAHSIVIKAGTHIAVDRIVLVILVGLFKQLKAGVFDPSFKLISLDHLISDLGNGVVGPNNVVVDQTISHQTDNGQGNDNGDNENCPGLSFLSLLTGLVFLRNGFVTLFFVCHGCRPI